MGAPLLSRSRRAAWRAVAVAALAACVDGPTGPGDRFGNLRINPVLAEGGRREELGLDRIHIVVRRGDGRPAVDTTLTYDAASDRTYDWLISLESEADVLDVRARVLAGGDSMYAGARDVTLREAWAGEGPVEDVLLDYVGRGAQAERIAIAPRDTVLTFGTSVQYHASGTDGQGRPVTDLVVFWETSDAEVATVSHDGVLAAPARRTKLHVIATTPQNLVDSTTVTFAPVATRVHALEGDGATARVAESVTLAVRVLAEDGLGVPGVPVRFEAPAGGAVADTLVTSDDDGVARTAGTLGTRPGEHVFTATAEGFPGTALRTTARSGPPARLGFTAQPEFAILDEVITPAVEVALRDAYDNPASEAGSVVTLGLGENPGNASLNGSTSVEAVDGIARFHDLVIDARGNGYTLRAVAPGLAAATSAAFDVTPRIAQIRVTPGHATLEAVGATQPYRAEALGADNTVIPGVTFTWTSADPDTATVDAAGLATAAGDGTTTITASAGGISGRATLTVDLARAITTVTVTPATATLTGLGATRQFSAEARDANGNVLPGVTFAWLSADPDTATVDPATGLATAVGDGTTSITATAGGISGGAQLTVDFTPAIAMVTVSPAIASLTTVGATQQFSAEARDGAGKVLPGVTFAWTSSDRDTATVDPATGLATAVGDGATSITATAGGISGSATLTVDLASSIAMVTVTPATATLNALDATQQFSAEARDADGNVLPGVTFAWTSADPDTATVDAAGLAAAAGDGTTTITASAGGISGRATLIVDLAPAIAMVTVSPAIATLTAIDATQQFTATARDANGNTLPGMTFVWSSGDPAVAAVDAATGRATAIANGTATVSATVGTKTGAADLTVHQTTTSVVVAPGAVTFAALDATQQLTATALDANGHPVSGAAFGWSSSSPTVATVDAVTGLATAVTEGTATITANAGAVAGTATITVDQVVTSVGVTPAAATLTALGVAQAFIAEGRDANGNVVVDAVFAWSSGNPTVATVDPVTGVATAVGNGAATVTANAGTATGNATLNVSQDVASVTVQPGTVTFTALGATRQLTAEARDANGHVVPGVPFTWMSDDATVATSDAVTGLATAIGNGTATISATTGTKSGAATVTVAQQVSTVAVAPDAATFNALGATAQLTAEARDAGGHLVPGVAFTWTSSDARVATVDAAGVVTAVANGAAIISAAAGGASGGAGITVRQAVASVDVTPEALTLDALAATVQLGATARDANGNLVEGSAFTWVSSDPDVARVSTTGLVTAVRNGAAAISATLDGVTDAATVTVAQVVTAVVVTPGATTLDALEATVQLVAEARDANGHVVPGVPFTWRSGRSNVGTVDGTGLVTAVDNGTAQITATTGAVNGTAQVTVAQVVRAVEVTPAEVALAELGATAQLTARARDANGHAVEHASVFWTSSDETVATVDQAGVVVAVREGEASVGAGAGGVTGSAHVVVRLSIEIAIAVTPGDAAGAENPINLAAQGLTPVAILTTAFNAADVDAATVRFASAAAAHWALEDVDGDGDIDLVLHFPTQALDLKPGDTVAELTGRTHAGQHFVGRDTVRAF